MDCRAISRIFLLLCCGTLISYCGLARPASAATSQPKTWVVCVAGYNLYRYTYGFEAGIYKLCRVLAGKHTDNLIVISPDAAAYHVQNAVPGKVVHGQRRLAESSPNEYSNANVTYASQEMTKDIFYGILSGNKTAVKGIGGEKVLQSGPLDTVILVFINIGDYGIMTLTNNQYLFAEDFVPLIEDLRDQNKFKQMLIYVDGQNAGSMFDGYLCTDCNIIALTNTAKQDDLELCHYNADVSAFTSTCYTYFLLQHLETISKNKDFDETTLFDLYQDVRTKTWFLDSISNLYGHLEMGNAKLSEFFPKQS